MRKPKLVSDTSISPNLALLLAKASQILPIENKAMTTASAIKNASTPFPIRDNITNEYSRYMQITRIIIEGNNFVIQNLDFNSYLIMGFSSLFGFIIFQFL